MIAVSIQADRSVSMLNGTSLLPIRVTHVWNHAESPRLVSNTLKKYSPSAGGIIAVTDESACTSISTDVGLRLSANQTILYGACKGFSNVLTCSLTASPSTTVYGMTSGIGVYASDNFSVSDLAVSLWTTCSTRISLIERSSTTSKAND